MKEKLSYILWGFLYIVCVGLSTVQERSLPIWLFLGLFGCLFYVPGILLIMEGCKEDKPKNLRQVRIISILSLSTDYIISQFYTGNKCSFLFW